MSEQEQKIVTIRQMMQDVVAREEIAQRFCYKSFPGVDMFMRRAGYRLKDKHYIVKEQREPVQIHDKTDVPQQVIHSLRRSNVRIEQVAKQYDYAMMEAFGTMMRHAGYVWSDREQTYAAHRLHDRRTIRQLDRYGLTTRVR